VPDADSGVKPGYEESIAIFIQPVSPELSRVWFRMAVADFDRPESDISRFQETIFLQDKPILESQRPRRLPLQPTAESHVGTDKASAAYRRYLKLSGITFGVYE
jgi:phenylpropionate dioxygenase-like ring-hydroxylating dioxygenase large terminal subunit